MEGVDAGGGGVEPAGGAVVAGGAGAVGPVEGGGDVRGAGGVRDTRGRGTGVALRTIRGVGAAAPTPGEVRSTTNRRSAPPAAPRAAVTRILGVAVADGCRACDRLGRVAGAGVATRAGVAGGAVAFRGSGPLSSTFVTANAPTAMSTTTTAAAPLRRWRRHPGEPGFWFSCQRATTRR